MLAIVPGGVVALMVPFYLQTALRSPRQVRSGRLLWLKLAIGIILLAVQTSNLVGWHAASLFRSKLALPAAAMSLLASVGIVIILCVTHTYSLQPSTFRGVFMSLTIIFDIAMACSCFRGHGFDTTGALSSYAIILKLTIVMLEQVSKRNLFQTKKSRCTVSREGAAGFWNRATFTWLYPLLTAGFGKELSRDDLPQIGQDFDCLQNFDKFFPIWERADKRSGLALAKVLLRTLPEQFTNAILPRLLFTLLKFSQPFLLLHIVQAVKYGGVDRDISWPLVLATACVFVGITVSRVLQAHYHFRVVTMIRGILVAAIYDKMQKLYFEDLIDAAAVTLMTADVTGVESLISLTYAVWSSSLQVGLGIWSLYMFVGPACFLMLIPGCSAFNNSATPVLVLGGACFWTRSGESLSAAEVFTILAIVAIASEPLTPCLQGIMEWTVGSTSLGRIHNFLVSTEAEDARQQGDCQLQTVGPATDDKSDAVPKVSKFAVQITAMGFTSLMQGPILRNINMQVPWGSLAIIWGPINCGKSTLFKTIVGESEITTGTVNVGTKLIAYCGQQPWIPNQTVRNVVIGVCDFLEERYNEVIYCCALDMDILHMPQGDQTMTGIAGCNLSGGQKQRLSLARAVYDELEVLVLDDVLSSLDALTAETIMSRLFGVNGLLRRLGRTVIMTTNRLEFLDYASLVYEMDMKGHIQLEAREESDDSASTSSATTSVVSESDADALCAAAPKPTEPPSVQPLEDDTELKDARMPRRTGTWSLYTYYLLPAGLFWVVSWVFVMAIAAAIEKMPLVFVRVWYSRDPNNFYYFIGFALFAVASIFCNTVMGMHFFFKILPKCAEKIHLNVANSVLFATLDFLGQTDAGYLLSRFSRDMTFVAHELPIHFLQFAFVFFTVICEAGIVAAGTAYFIPAMAFILVALYAIQLFYLRTSRQLRLLELESSERLFTHFTETSKGIQHIRSFGWRDDFNASFLIRSWTNLETTLGAVARIKDFCADTPIEKDTLRGAELPENWPATGLIDFNGVSASYTAGDGSFRRALENVTFTIYPGEKVGISGRTASGKSSIFLALLRMVKFGGGISIDGRDITTIPRELLRSRITTMSQDGVELNASVRFNIYPFSGPHPEEDTITSTLRLVGLWAHIQSYGGIENTMSKMCFSASQRQLFFLARAMVHQRTANTRIVLVDEATSAMSKEGDEQTRALMDYVFSECVVLQIAHHQDWLTDMNVKIRMDFGKLVSIQRRRRNGQWVESL
ncbi:hypothetical protein NHJ6243_009225 [Beauveria neobassiana]